MAESTENNGKLKDNIGIYVLSIAVLIVAGIVVFFVGHACSDQYHSQYATGEQYTVSGYVEKAKETSRRYGRNKHTVYKVELTTTADLPNGTCKFTTSDVEEYEKVSQFADASNTLVNFTISEKGYLIDAREASNVTSTG